MKYENGDTIYEAYGIGGSVAFYTKNMGEIQMDLFSIRRLSGCGDVAWGIRYLAWTRY